eukprot:GFUD01017244.1.p1 GENE.GFUD01017244.1~~GFUD01017244.1.p1  ORF type:complete len:1121 (-),score=378.11 GFUD01017244.1:210-3572(-)
MCDRDGLWPDTSDSEDADEENNNVEDNDDTNEAQEDNRNMNRDLLISNHSSRDAEPEQAIFDMRRIVRQEVHDEVVAENIESNQARDGDVVIVGEDIAVEIVGETAVLADTSEEETDDDMVGSAYQLPVINTATTAEVLGISSDSDAEYEVSEDTIDVGEAHSNSTPGTSSQNTPGPSHSQPHSPISVFYHTTGILPHPATTTNPSGKSVSRGKRFPWTSYNNFGFSSDSEDEIDVAARPREGGEWSSSSSITRPTAIQPVPAPGVPDVHGDSHTFYPFSGGETPARIPRIVSDPHDAWSFSRATHSLPASRPNFDQRRFLREISRVEGDLVEEAEHPAANQEDQPVPGPNSQPPAGDQELPTIIRSSQTPSQTPSQTSSPAGRISPATGTSALSRVIHNSGILAISGNSQTLACPHTTRIAATPTSSLRALRVAQAPCTHTARASNSPRMSQTPLSPQTSPTLARHSCPHRVTRAISVTGHPHPTFSQSLATPSTPTTSLADIQSQTDSRIRLARDFLRALSSPPIPSVPSLPNTTIRRILSVNTNELLGGDLASPPTSPQTSMYGPLPLQQQAVRTPRFEPQIGPGNATPGQQQETVDRVRDSNRDVQSIDRIDRILQLSRRTRVINDTIERSISRDLDEIRSNPVPLTLMPSGRTATVASTVVGAETAREDVRRQAQRILAEMQQQRREDARREEVGRRSLERAHQVTATTNYARERVERAAENVSNEFVRDVTATNEAEAPVAKKARIEPSGQFEADIAEALKRSLEDQGTEPQPGCSHWEAADDTKAATDASAEQADVVTAAPKAAVDPGPDFEAMYRSLHTSHRKLVTELQSSLECPVCLDTIRTAPVQCCRNGHLICALCITRTHICPTCRAPMTLQSGQRCVSHSANRLVDLLPHPCTNRDSGCEVEELVATLTQHEQNCPYRLVRCPVGYCMDNIPMASLSEHVSALPHLLTTHAYSTTNNLLTFSRFIPSQDMGLQSTFQLRSFDPIRFTFSGSIFYLQTITSPDRRLLYNFVQMEGTKESCAKYWASITVASFNPYTASQVCQTVRPTPLDLHCRDDLQSIGEALLMTEKVVVSVLQYDTVMARYQFKVKVKMMHSNEIGDQEQQEGQG